MQYGRFSDDGAEYIITRPDTPRPWYNHFGNNKYAVTLSHTGGGYSHSYTDDYRNLTWYIPRYDEAGRYLYLRDNDDDAYWTGTYGPMREPADHFECRHGQGWTTFVIERNGIRSEMTIFVPLDGTVELWTVKVTNLTHRARRLTAFPFLEWTIDNGAQNIDDLSYAASTDADFESDTNSVVASRREPWRFGFCHAFMTTDVTPDGWDVNRAAFVGPGRTLRNPLAVEQGTCTKTPSYAEISVGALSIPLELAAGGSSKFNVMVGIAQAKPERRRLRTHWLSGNTPAREFKRLRTFWNDMNDGLQIQTPDEEFDRFVNRWLTNHVYTLGASISARGLRQGFRNFVQDGMGMLYLDPAASREFIITGMKHQLESGECFIWFYRDGRQPVGPKHIDTKIWLVYLLCGYIKETGDEKILDEMIPFWKSEKKTSVLQRIYLILDKCWQDRGKHGLSLVGEGDWNDNLTGMGKEGKGESVWMSLAFLWALRETAELAKHVGDEKNAAKTKRRIQALRKALHTHAWDGDRYIMGYNDSYMKIGSRKSQHVKAFLLPQVWSVLSGAATPEQEKKLWQVVDTKLASEYGPLLMNKPFTKPDPSIGKITFLAQGMSENGPSYSHGTAFKLVADGLAGRGDALYTDLLRLFPYTHDPEVTLGEPYVMSNFYRPAAVPRKHGATHRSWITSTPSWTIRAVVEGMMGMRTTYDGIEINPSIPRAWKTCRARRRIRNATYEMEIENPRGVESGVTEVWLDGTRLESSLLPFLDDGQVHQVKVILG